MLSNILGNAKIYPEIIFKLQFDGCSKGNPGLAGTGSVIYNNTTNQEIWSESKFIGENISNNYAEYMGLIIGLQKAQELNITQILVEGDSMLVIKQMRGEFVVKSPNLIKLNNQAKTLSSQFEYISYNHIYRKDNKRADELANIAIKDFLSKKILYLEYKNIK
jgi:ribonuclease HI